MGGVLSGDVGPRRRIARAVAGALVGVLVGAAVVGAHGGDTTRIHACKSASDLGTLYITDANDACSDPDLTPVDWNIAGPSGSTGAQGPAGAAGATGPAGATGAPGLPSDVPLRVQVETSGRLELAYQYDVTAKCRPGEHVVTGGYHIRTEKDEYRLKLRSELWRSHPLADGSGWRTVLRINPYSTNAIPASLAVFVACTPQGPAR